MRADLRCSLLTRGLAASSQTDGSATCLLHPHHYLLITSLLPCVPWSSLLRRRWPAKHLKTKKLRAGQSRGRSHRELPSVALPTVDHTHRGISSLDCVDHNPCIDRFADVPGDCRSGHASPNLPVEANGSYSSTKNVDPYTRSSAKTLLTQTDRGTWA